MCNKYKHKRQEIITTAFAQWGKSHFAKTSLNMVSKQLGITKTALYHYFTSKAQLLAALEDQFQKDWERAFLNAISTSDLKDFKILIKRYYSFFFHFFNENTYYYSFFLKFIHKKNIIKSDNCINLTEKLKILRPSLIHNGFPDDDAIITPVLRYIQFTANFWLMQLFHIDDNHSTSRNCFGFNKKIPEEIIRKQIEKASTYCLKGLIIEQGVAKIDITAIQTQSWIKSAEMLEPDRIFTAFEKVIGERGYENASVEKIAAYIGITKSSLYFYFKNKDDMLHKTIQREQNHFLNLVINRLSLYQSLPEKIYCLMVLIASYVYNNPTMITVLNWAHYQNIGINIPHKYFHEMRKHFDFIHKAIANGHLRGLEEDSWAIMAFIHFLVISNMFSFQTKKNGYTHVLNSIKHFYFLFAHGLLGELKRIKQSVKGVLHV